jgi:hypothetical protein
MNLPTSSNANNLNQVAFFMLQPVAITVEDFVIYLGKRAGVKESRKCYKSLDIHIPMISTTFRVDKSYRKRVDICLVHV